MGGGLRWVLAALWTVSVVLRVTVARAPRARASSIFGRVRAASPPARCPPPARWFPLTYFPLTSPPLQEMGGSAAGQVHRGDLALRVLGPHALQSIGIATGLGFLGGMIWKFTVRDPNLAKIAKVNNVRLGEEPGLAGACTGV